MSVPVVYHALIPMVEMISLFNFSVVMSHCGSNVHFLIE